jgi:serine/threonine protein kinase
MTAGTLGYLAPETLQEADRTKKVDVFAFGLILYELLVGESVFPKDPHIVQMYKLHQNQSRPEIPGWIAPPVASLIELCWSVNPKLRPAFDEVYKSLEDSGFPFFEDVLPHVTRDYASQILAEETYCKVE